MKERAVNWIKKVVTHPLATLWLALVSFTEASFFPLPPDMFLMPMVALQRSKWFIYSFVTALYSVAGGAFGYVIGMFLYDSLALPLIRFYGLETQLFEVAALFQEHTFSSVFVSAFTPIPYKVFTIASGMFEVNLGIFILAAFLGRWLRFLFVSWLMYAFGERITKVVFRSFNTLSLVLVALVIVVVLFITH